MMYVDVLSYQRKPFRSDNNCRELLECIAWVKCGLVLKDVKCEKMNSRNDSMRFILHVTVTVATADLRKVFELHFSAAKCRR